MCELRDERHEIRLLVRLSIRPLLLLLKLLLKVTPPGILPGSLLLTHSTAEEHVKDVFGCELRLLRVIMMSVVAIHAVRTRRGVFFASLIVVSTLGWIGQALKCIADGFERILRFRLWRKDILKARQVSLL